jgi:hypothetical protein
MLILRKMVDYREQKLHIYFDTKHSKHIYREDYFALTLQKKLLRLTFHTGVNYVTYHSISTRVLYFSKEGALERRRGWW